MSMHIIPVRTFLREGDTEPEYPADVIATISLKPSDLFGVSDQFMAQTAIKANTEYLQWENAYDGSYYYKGYLPTPPELSLPEKGYDLDLKGDRLTIQFKANDEQKVRLIMSVLCRTLPVLLSVRTKCYVWIAKCDVSIGGVVHRMPLAHSTKPPLRVVIESERDEQILQGLKEAITLQEEHGRLMLGYYYYRQAFRLRCGHPFTISFLPEVVLNLAKAVEIILSGNRDKARQRAKDYNLDKSFIEERIIPILLVRNELDVGHPSTGMLNQSEIKVVSDYIDQAFGSVTRLLDEVFIKVSSGEITLPRVSGSLNSNQTNLLRSLRQYLEVH